MADREHPLPAWLPAVHKGRKKVLSNQMPALLQLLHEQFFQSQLDLIYGLLAARLAVPMALMDGIMEKSNTPPAIQHKC